MTVTRNLLLLVFLAMPAAVSGQQGHAHAHASHASVDHPEPRKGVTAERVLSGTDMKKKRAQGAYEMAAKIPHVLDGIFCHCDCHDVHGKRSLLECFEVEMASSCGICMGSAETAYRMHEKGKTLDEIRTAIDAKYGPSS